MIYFIIIFFISVLFLTSLFLNKKREILQSNFAHPNKKNIIRKLDILFAKFVANLIKYASMIYEKIVFEIQVFPKRLMTLLHFIWDKGSRRIDNFFEKFKHHKKIEKSKK